MPWMLVGMLVLGTSISAQDAGQLEFDDFSDFKEAVAFFNGVQPISYVVHMQIPLLTEKASNKTKRQTGTRYSTKGQVSMTFKWAATSSIFQGQNLLALHSKWISIKGDSVRVWQLHQLTGQDQKLLPVFQVQENDDNEVVTVRLTPETQLEQGEMYRLEIGEFSGLVEDDGAKNGIFLTSPGLATQFQLNDARRAFPCVDMPGKKAVFTFSMTHPSPYVALFNTEAESTAPTETLEGWTKTTFQATPIMATYTLGFTLIPKSFVEKASLTTKATDGLRISIFYNPDRLSNPRQAASLLRFASQAYEILRHTFDPRLPLYKLDVSIVKGLSILGMENWGLVNLREEFIMKENEVEQFGLLTHEIVHQWIGDLATTSDWKHLCVQEGLTEHYARRALADFYGGKGSTQYQRYIFIRYLPAVQNETNNVGLKPIRQDFQGFDEAVAFCFGRVPFIWTMIERIVGGRQPFDLMINRFLTDFSFKNFVLDDLASYLTIANASHVLQYYVDHGGYPSLFVHRLNETTYRLRQRQIIPLSSALPENEPTFEVPSTKDIWPIPLSTVEGQRLIMTSDYDLPADMIPFDTRRVPLLNPDFAYFYRVNYEIITWVAIADALLSAPESYTEVTKAQFLNDYCFFRGLNLIRMAEPYHNRTFVDELTRRFLTVQSQLELSTNIYVRFYTKGC